MKMLKIVLSNLFRKKATRLYPVQKRQSFADARGEIVNNIDSCIFCGLCSRKCPVSCITVDKASRVWKHNPYQCIYCGLCVENCPTKSLTQKPEYAPATYGKTETSLKGQEKLKK